MTRTKGFTLIELLVVIGIIAVLAVAAFVALNPGRQFSQANNTQRRNHVSATLNAIGQRITDNRGNFATGCVAGAIPTGTAQTMADDNPASATEYDIAPCLVPTYLPSMPFDPTAAGAQWTSATNYNTGYTVIQDANGRVTVSAPSAELGETISVTR